MWERARLEALKRRELIDLCKQYEIKCTGKNSELIEKLLEIDNQDQMTMERGEESDGVISTRIPATEEPKPCEVIEKAFGVIEESKRCEDIEGDGEVILNLKNPPAKLPVWKRPPSIPVRPINKSQPSKALNPPAMKRPEQPKPVASHQQDSQDKAATGVKMRPKFDLQASLQRPLGYKPYTGPITK